MAWISVNKFTIEMHFMHDYISHKILVICVFFLLLFFIAWGKLFVMRKTKKKEKKIMKKIVLWKLFRSSWNFCFLQNKRNEYCIGRHLEIHIMPEIFNWLLFEWWLQIFFLFHQQKSNNIFYVNWIWIFWIHFEILDSWGRKKESIFIQACDEQR